jgi:hypothetical protein
MASKYMLRFYFGNTSYCGMVANTFTKLISQLVINVLI